jgi:lysophospholipase L1-like esterase
MGLEWHAQHKKMNNKLNIKTICVFSDSIAWGACDYKRGGWVEKLKVDMLKNSDIQVYNFGVCGNTTVNLLDRFQKEADIMNPEIIIFAIGINDSRYLGGSKVSEVGLEEFKTNISILINQARKIA